MVGCSASNQHHRQETCQCILKSRQCESLASEVGGSFHGQRPREFSPRSSRTWVGSARPSEFKFSAIFSLALMTVVNFPNGACTAQLCAVATDLRREIMYFIVFLFD